VIDAEGGVGIVGRNELDIAFFLVTEVEGLDGELSIEVCHHYIAVLGVFALVDDEYVAIVDIGVLHAFAHYTTVEGALGIVYEFLVEVDALLYVILCRRGKTASDASIGIGKGEDAAHIGTVYEYGIFLFFLHN
jgi:hypothetical protein